MAKKSKETVEDTSTEPAVQEVLVEAEVVETPVAVEIKELPTVLETLPTGVKLNGNQVVRGKTTFYF